MNITEGIDSAFDGETPVEEEYDQDDLDGLKEYGYGFYARFLTTYPSRLLNGKNAPWYFVSRLTKNLPVSDGKMGDRMLAIW